MSLATGAAVCSGGKFVLSTSRFFSSTVEPAESGAHRGGLHMRGGLHRTKGRPWNIHMVKVSSHETPSLFLARFFFLATYFSYREFLSEREIFPIESLFPNDRFFLSRVFTNEIFLLSRVFFLTRYFSYREFFSLRNIFPIESFFLTRYFSCREFFPC